MDEEGKLLAGGNMTPVVRVGDTVRRVPGPWTPTVRRLLMHLQERGLAGVPEPLGFDSRGREITSFIEGETGAYPLPPYMWTAATLEEVARLIRHLHDATADFPLERDDRWQLPEHQPVEVVCHNDLAPYNVVFRDGHPVGIVGFVMASPGSRSWDLAYAAYRFVPLTDPSNPDTPTLPLDIQSRRLDLFLDSYGGAPAPQEIVETLPIRLEELIEFTADQALKGDRTRRELLKGHLLIYERDLAYIVENGAALGSG